MARLKLRDEIAQARRSAELILCELAEQKIKIEDFKRLSHTLSATCPGFLDIRLQFLMTYKRHAREQRPIVGTMPTNVNPAEAGDAMADSLLFSQGLTMEIEVYKELYVLDPDDIDSLRESLSILLIPHC